jgi:hypothetical protein
MTRSYKLRINFADSSTATIKFSDYSLMVSTLVGMMMRGLDFTFTASTFGRKFDYVEHDQLEGAVKLWLDVFALKAVEAHMTEAHGRLYSQPMTAAEAEALAF